MNFYETPESNLETQGLDCSKESKHIFKISTVLLILLYLIFHFLPEINEPQDVAASNLIAQSGYNSLIYLTDFEALIFLVTQIFGVIVLYTFTKWSRIAFSISLFSQYIASTISGYVVSTPLDSTFSYPLVLIQGVLITLIYFSDIKTLFQ